MEFRLVVLPNIAVRLLEKLLISIQLVLEERLSQRAIGLEFACQGVLPA